MQDERKPISRREAIAGSAVAALAIIAGSAVPVDELGDQGLAVMAEEMAALDAGIIDRPTTEEAISNELQATLDNRPTEYSTTRKEQRSIAAMMCRQKAQSWEGIRHKLEAALAYMHKPLNSPNPADWLLLSALADAERLSNS